MTVALISGAIAGLTLFSIQHWTVQPLIEQAEEYESTSVEPHDLGETGWQPKGSFQRHLFTAFASILYGIGLAAILFGIAASAGGPLSAGRGALWGLAGLTCFVLAPAVGLPPVPPGTALAGLEARQMWWVATVLATAVGVWLLFRQKRWSLRIAGMIIALIPHAIGAPEAVGENAVPDVLVRRFVISSLTSQAVFWIVLGAVGGFVYERIYSSK